jgi:hypothetical protein
MAFNPGDEKPANSGRQKGVKNKRVRKLSSVLRKKGVDIEQIFADALLNNDVDLLKVLAPFLPYIATRLGSLPADPTAKKDKPKEPPSNPLSVIHGKYNKPS